MKQNHMSALIASLAIAMSLAAFVPVFGRPVISMQPQSQSVSVGANVTFRVSVADGVEPLNYQWRRNETALAGETKSMLTLTNAQAAQVGSYTVVVVDGFNESITSEAALLTIDPTFTKITAGQVVTDLDEFWSAAWGDYDNDGFVDLLMGALKKTCLYRNNGDGTFTKITAGALVTDARGGELPLWGDYDNDGSLDVYVQNAGTLKNALYRNNGTGSFSKVTAALDGPSFGGAALGDYNNDGNLDLLVANWFLANALFRNNGNGTFDKMSASQVGDIVSYDGRSGAATWADYDDDGDLDALITSGNQINNLFYRNNGNGTFTQLLRPDIGDLDDMPGYWAGTSWFDYDNDGDLDVFIPDGGPFELRNDAFYRNDGGKFTKLTEAQVGPIVADGKTGFGSGAADYDNDGWVDLFVTVSGRYFTGEVGDNNLLYHNNGDGTFSRVTTGSLVNDGGVSVDCAWADYNNDGFMDLVVANGIDGITQNNFLYRNNGNTNHWLKLKLNGTTSNRGAMGAKVRVKASIGGRTFWQLRVTHDTDGFGNQQDPRPNFGLGNASVAETVRIEWPSGIVQELHNVSANQILTVTEPMRLQATGRGAFEFRSWKGQVFGVEASPNLSVWSSLGSVTNTTGLVQFSDPAAPSLTSRFYRVLPK